MNTLHLAENLIRLRRGRGVTQEEVAAFLGVTKASVSKWENSQSLPDILLLPQIASYYGVTVDELLGYEPQLGKEQIQKLYRRLADDFAARPFQEVQQEVRKLVKKYYSCYPFLFQMGILWMNHYALAGEPEQQKEVLKDVQKLCDHMIKNCRDVGLCNDAIFLRAAAALLLGRAGEVIETVEDLLNPYRLVKQSDSILIQAYLMLGETEKADSYAQVNTFLHLNLLISNAVQYLTIHARDRQACERTLERIDGVIDVYHLEGIMLNTVAVYQLQAAITCCLHSKTEEALKRLEIYSRLVLEMEGGCSAIQGDAYFSRLDEWVRTLDLGTQPVRNEKLILQSACQGLEHPAFSVLSEEKRFMRIKKCLQEAMET